MGVVDQACFIYLFSRHYNSIYRIAFHMLGNEEEARDVTQESFLRAWQLREKLRGIKAAVCWLRKTTVNLSIDLLRSRKFQPDSIDLTPNNNGNEGDADVLPYQLTSDLSPDPAEYAIRCEETHLVYQALEQLPLQYRAVAILRDIEGLSYKKISEVLELPENTVKSQVLRARKRLRILLAPYFEDFEGGVKDVPQRQRN